MEHEKPTFNDILSLMTELPNYPAYEGVTDAPLEYLSGWLSHYSRILDFSHGFMVNRCALYWAGYDAPDGIDGQAFVDSCQDSRGSLRSLSEILDTDLQIFELDPHTHIKRTSDDLAMAASYGMMAIEEGTQLFCACSFGQGVESAAYNALEEIKSMRDLQSFMTGNCGLDHAAMLGVAIASSLKGIPLILEGQSGLLVKSLLENHTNQQFGNIITTENLNLPQNHDLPGHKMITTAILLKTLYAGVDKTDCGKIKKAA